MNRLRTLARRLWGAITTWPDAVGWGRCGVVAATGLLCMMLLARWGGLWLWRPDLANWPQHLAMVMIVPALGEEVVFRGLLVPDRGETRRPVLWIAAAVGLFVVWHVFEAVTFLPGARPLFLTPAFLACAAVLGAVCAVMRYQTGSLWPPVIFHGLVVFLWQALLGAPDVRALLEA